MSGNSLRQTVHTHCASVHQTAKLVAALLKVAGVTAGLAESNGSLPSGLGLTSPTGRLPSTGISCSGTLRSIIEYGLPFLVYLVSFPHYLINFAQLEVVTKVLETPYSMRKIVRRDCVVEQVYTSQGNVSPSSLANRLGSR